MRGKVEGSKQEQFISTAATYRLRMRGGATCSKRTGFRHAKEGGGYSYQKVSLLLNMNSDSHPAIQPSMDESHSTMPSTSQANTDDTSQQLRSDSSVSSLPHTALRMPIISPMQPLISTYQSINPFFYLAFKLPHPLNANTKCSQEETDPREYACETEDQMQKLCPGGVRRKYEE